MTHGCTHLSVHLLPDMSRSLGQVVWRPDSAEEFLQLWKELLSALAELQHPLINVHSTLRESDTKSTSPHYANGTNHSRKGIE